MAQRWGASSRWQHGPRSSRLQRRRSAAEVKALKAAFRRAHGRSLLPCAPVPCAPVPCAPCAPVRRCAAVAEHAAPKPGSLQPAVLDLRRRGYWLPGSWLPAPDDIVHHTGLCQGGNGKRAECIARFFVLHVQVYCSKPRSFTFHVSTCERLAPSSGAKNIPPWRAIAGLAGCTTGP